MMIRCTKCGKKCVIRPARVEQGSTKPETFMCRPCNLRYHKRNQKGDLDTTHQQYIKTLAMIRRQHGYE